MCHSTMHCSQEAKQDCIALGHTHVGTCREQHLSTHTFPDLDFFLKEKKKKKQKTPEYMYEHASSKHHED